ncbi:hypothetical protein ACVWZZ_004592 [Bradyrhizobium sp. LM6.10]
MPGIIQTHLEEHSIAVFTHSDAMSSANSAFKVISNRKTESPQIADGPGGTSLLLYLNAGVLAGTINAA